MIRFLPFIVVSFVPFLLRFARHCRRIRVLHLEPIGRATRTIGGILAFRDNAFEAELAGVSEDSRAVALDIQSVTTRPNPARRGQVPARRALAGRGAYAAARGCGKEAAYPLGSGREWSSSNVTSAAADWIKLKNPNAPDLRLLLLIVGKE
jgi:hypothetical protein